VLTETKPAVSVHILTIRVYYEDTDFSGVVYHASYLRFLERGRTEMLRSLGIDQAALHSADRPLAFVVRRMLIDWLKPARMDDMLTIETAITEVRGASLRLMQRVLRDRLVLATAEVTIACVADGRPVRLPLALRQADSGPAA
jgi:acyl-CoA thioester hydrolase